MHGVLPDSAPLRCRAEIDMLRQMTVVMGCRRGPLVTYAAKELHFNRSGEALKRMQAGVDKLASVVGVTLGPKVCHLDQRHLFSDMQRLLLPCFEPYIYLHISWDI